MARSRPSDRSEPVAAPRPSSISSANVDTSDWPSQAADTIERLVQGVRDKTTGPAISAARWFVAGLFVLVAGTMVAVLAAIGLVRALDAYLPASVFGDEHVWVADLLVGAPPFVVGLWALRKRSQPSER